MRIVIADSKKSDREALENVIQSIDGKCPYEVVGAAADGKEGFKIVEELRPDLLIVDIQLSGMNGLSLIRRIREEQIPCKVIVLTADTDFKRAQKAIQLDVDDYQLKPVRKQKIQKALLHIETKLKEEQALNEAFTQESIFMGCLNGQINSGESLYAATREKFGFSIQDPGALFVVWLGSGYTQQREYVQKFLENAGAANDFSVCVLPVAAWHLLVTIVYRKNRTGVGSMTGVQEAETLNDYFQKEYIIFRDRIVPDLCGNVKGELICMWEESVHMQDFLCEMRTLRRIREWNLLFDRGDLIRSRDIASIQVAPFKYPAELEKQVKKAVLTSNGEEIKKCFYTLYDILRRKPYSPREIKECMIRFNMAVLGAYKTAHEIRSELEVQNSMQRITEAISWGQIREAMEEFFHNIELDTYSNGEDENLSPLVQKAMEMVRKYYDHGVTLDEIAEYLFVSEEYLSTQFKKETGSGFAETVRRKRIERIKELLSNTNLKINQIAELTGYNDPKYMSRVFKEEVGMLPTEFRKTVH